MKSGAWVLSKAVSVACPSSRMDHTCLFLRMSHNFLSLLKTGDFRCYIVAALDTDSSLTLAWAGCLRFVWRLGRTISVKSNALGVQLLSPSLQLGPGLGRIDQPGMAVLSSGLLDFL